MIKNILKIIMKILKIALIIIIVLFASFVLLQRFSNNNTSIFGYRMFAVVTGSMEPVYSVGDVILCKEVDTNKLKVGDDVTYLGKEGTFKDKVITHRLKNITEKDGKKIFYTQGVATNNIDPPIEASQIYGKVSRKLLILSAFHSYSSTSIGFFLCVIIPIMLLVGTEVVQTMLEKHEEQHEKHNEIQQNSQQNNYTTEQLKQELESLQQMVDVQNEQYEARIANNAQMQPQTVGVNNMNVQAQPQAVGVNNMNVQAQPQAVGVNNISAQVQPQAVGVNGINAQMQPQTVGVYNINAQVQPQAVGVNNISAQEQPQAEIDSSK